MIGIVIVAHSDLAFAYIAAIEQIMGPQTGICAVSFDATHDRVAKENEIFAAAEKVDKGCGVVILSDLHGSSPANLALSACAHKNRKFLTGVNVPMLLKLTKCRNMDIQCAIDAAQEAGKKYITNPEPTLLKEK